MDKLEELAARVEALDGPSNKIDVLVECAFNDCRPNSAGTKVIYNNKAREEVYIARDWTISQAQRDRTSNALRAKAAGHD